jgi:hypothetical protein
VERLIGTLQTTVGRLNVGGMTPRVEKETKVPLRRVEKETKVPLREGMEMHRHRTRHFEILMPLLVTFERVPIAIPWIGLKLPFAPYCMNVDPFFVDENLHGRPVRPKVLST